MMKTYSLRIGNTIAYVAMITANILANTLPLGGMKTSQISAMYPTIFTPPGITFSIWGVIYVLLGAFVVMQYFDRFRNEAESIGPYFIISCVLNTMWIFAWQYQQMVIATALILLLLLSLIKIYELTRSHTFVARTGFSIYYAWITVATMASVFVLVKTLTGNAPVTPIEPRAITPFTPGNYTDIIIVAGDPVVASYVSLTEYVFAGLAVIATAAITMLHINKYGDIAYTATIYWALGGLSYKLMTSNELPVYMLITMVLAFTMIGFALLSNMDDLVFFKAPARRNKSRYFKIKKEGAYDNL